jgi:hypothetical protein
VTWETAPPTLTAMALSDMPSRRNSRIVRITACCSGSAISAPSSLTRHPKGAVPPRKRPRFFLISLGPYNAFTDTVAFSLSKRDSNCVNNFDSPFAISPSKSIRCNPIAHFVNCACTSSAFSALGTQPSPPEGEEGRVRGKRPENRRKGRVNRVLLSIGR